MNLPNKLTISRIIMSILIIIILLGGNYTSSIFGFEIPKLYINESVVVDSKYWISGILFIIASLTDFFDGYIARKYNLVTDFGKMIDAIADKVLVNGVLILLASSGFISAIIPVVIVIRDIIVDSVKMLAGSKGKVVAAIKIGKLKTACLMVGIVLTLFYNLPFELINLRISDALLILACVFAIISAIQYYQMNKKYISTVPEKEDK